MTVYLPQAVGDVSSSSTQLGWMERELEVQVRWIHLVVAAACQVLVTAPHSVSYVRTAAVELWKPLQFCVASSRLGC